MHRVQINVCNTVNVLLVLIMTPFRSKDTNSEYFFNLKIKNINYDQLGLVMWGAALQSVYIHIHRIPEGET